MMIDDFIQACFYPILNTEYFHFILRETIISMLKILSIHHKFKIYKRLKVRVMDNWN